MYIQMNFDAACLEYILKNNLLEKIRPYLSLGEVLEWMAEHPDDEKQEVAQKLLFILDAMHMGW